MHNYKLFHMKQFKGGEHMSYLLGIITGIILMIVLSCAATIDK